MGAATLTKWEALPPLAQTLTGFTIFDTALSDSLRDRARVLPPSKTPSGRVVHRLLMTVGFGEVVLGWMSIGTCSELLLIDFRIDEALIAPHLSAAGPSSTHCSGCQSASELRLHRY